MSSASSLTGQEWVHRLARQRPEIPGVVRHALVQQGLQGTQRQTLGDSTRSPRGVNGEYNDGCFTPSATAVDGVSLQQPLVPEQEERLRAIETRLQTQEPVQYIEGAAEFYRRMFTVGPGTLIPREATDTIIDSVLALVPDREQPYKILDLGTGSGCILATLLLELPHSTGTGVDISSDALCIAQSNISMYNLSRRCQLVESHWTADLSPTGSYDVIVSNPPYIPASDLQYLHAGVVEYEPRLALEAGDDGLTAYREIASQLSSVAHSGTLIVVEIGVSSREFATCRQIQEQQDTAGTSASAWLDADTLGAGQVSRECQGEFAQQVNDIFRQHGCQLLRVQRDLDGIERALSFRYNPTT